VSSELMSGQRMKEQDRDWFLAIVDVGIGMVIPGIAIMAISIAGFGLPVSIAQLLVVPAMLAGGLALGLSVFHAPVAIVFPVLAIVALFAFWMLLRSVDNRWVRIGTSLLISVVYLVVTAMLFWLFGISA